MPILKFIVGLGNSGAKYHDTRHNAGFWWVDRLAQEQNITFSYRQKFYGYLAKISTDTHDIWLLKPDTFMNHSGQAVVALANYYQILPNEILIVHDEIDFSPGIIKLKQGGRSGGHNGLKNIDTHLSTTSYWRLRIGVGHPGHKEAVAQYVLHPPSKVDEALIDDAMTRSFNVWSMIASGDFEAAMLKLHTH